MIKYMSEEKNCVYISEHTFNTSSGDVYIKNQTIPVNHPLWFDYGLNELAEQGLIEVFQHAQTSLNELIESIDAAAANVTTKWTRFAEEYKEREAAALAYRQAGYDGGVSIYITSFADPADINYQAATDLILKQADDLRALQAQLAAERMRKYELKQPDLSFEQITALHDEIVENIEALGASYE